MEKTLSKQQLIAIEKIRNNQRVVCIKATTRIVKQSKSTENPERVQSKPDFPTTAQRQPLFPATHPQLYGLSRPVEACEKGERLIKRLKRFNDKNTAKKLVKRKKVKLFSFTPVTLVNKIKN